MAPSGAIFLYILKHIWGIDMEKSEVPQITLSIFLIKKDLDEEDFISNYNSLDQYTIKDNQKIIGDLFIKKPKFNSPSWTKFFSEYLDRSVFGKTSALSALLIVKTSGRVFAIPFGQGGRFLLEAECYEERFGLLVTLNSIGENKIRSIDKKTFDALATHTSVQTSQDASPQDFGLDIEKDLVSGVTGSPEDISLGNRLSGMDSLHVSLKISIEELSKTLSSYYKQYRSKNYQKNFKWIDQITEIKSTPLIEELNKILIGEINANNFERCWMAAPLIINWHMVDGFRYGFRKKNPKHYDIHLSEFLSELFFEQEITLKQLLGKKIYCIGDDDQIMHEWTAFKCIYCELDYNNNSYLLSSGKWYKVTKDFVNEVNEYFKQIPTYERTLPNYKDANETKYNIRVSKESEDLALMDRDFISFGGGYNKLEFCDLYSAQKDIIHVKRYGGAGNFSHLFSQGTVSGELFGLEPKFRDLVNQKLPSTHKINNCSTRPARDEYRIIFAIISDADESELTIPFFSRLNLRTATRRLTGYGYRVAKTKISVDKTISKLQRHDS